MEVTRLIVHLITADAVSLRPRVLLQTALSVLTAILLALAERVEFLGASRSGWGESSVIVHAFIFLLVGISNTFEIYQ